VHRGAHPCAFLDRDGTVIAEKHYLCDPAGVELLPGAAAGLRHLRELGYRLVLVTNQSGIGRGYFTQADVDAVHARLGTLLAAEAVSLDGIYVCPHRPEDHCACRKPATGLVERACADLDLDPAASVVIGDKACDIDLGHRCRMTTILVRTGYGATETCQAHAVAANLTAAAAWVAGQSGLRAGGSARTCVDNRALAMEPGQPNLPAP
jgi:histidinol-phosphate phosphatase family protein